MWVAMPESRFKSGPRFLHAGEIRPRCRELAKDANLYRRVILASCLVKLLHRQGERGSIPGDGSPPLAAT